MAKQKYNYRLYDLCVTACVKAIYENGDLDNAIEALNKYAKIYIGTIKSKKTNLKPNVAFMKFLENGDGYMNTIPALAYSLKSAKNGSRKRGL